MPLALLGIFLPGYLFVLGALPFYATALGSAKFVSWSKAVQVMMLALLASLWASTLLLHAFVDWPWLIWAGILAVALYRQWSMILLVLLNMGLGICLVI